MTDSVNVSITIKASKAKVFDAFVNHINEWWLRMGKFSYSFAPEGVEPGQIHIEPRLGGRFYEVFANGQEFQIGEVVAWQPHDHLQLTWKGEEYNAPTLIDVSFSQTGEFTKVTLNHSGWTAAGVPSYAEGYGQGWNELLEVFASWQAGNEK